MQADGAVTKDAFGKNAGVVQTAGSADIGRSKNALDEYSRYNNTLPLRILGSAESHDSRRCIY